MSSGSTNEDLRHRRPHDLKANEPTDQGNDVQTPQSEDEEDVDKVEQRLDRIKELLPQGSDSMGSYVDSSLSGLPPRWRNWIVRGVFTIFMIAGFAFIVSKGATWLMFLVFVIQLKCFNEIIKIGLYVYRLYDLPWFRALSWYFLITSDYFFFGESLIDYWSIVLRKDQLFRALVSYHRIISFTMYCFGFLWFVLSLRKGLYLRQFSLFAFTHCTLLMIVTQSFLMINNLLQGLVWFLIPVSMIICCDIMSYVFGFFFGKTPLIKLSPKKTVEGFIGGGISTIIFGLIMANWLADKPSFVCPVESYYEDAQNCTFPLAFQQFEYKLPWYVGWTFKLAGWEPYLHLTPFLTHSVILAMFASFIAPFGGFFASGFKRAFKIKDFGDIIPGHGGLMDRFDCQLLMGTFVYVYIHSFIRFPNANKIVQQILWLPQEEQLEVFEALKTQLIQAGILNG